MAKKILIFMLISLLSLVFITGCDIVNTGGDSGDGGSTDAGDAGNEGTSVFDFTLMNHDGSNVSLSDFEGQYLFIAFGTDWCPYCKDQAAYIESVVTDYQNAGYNFNAMEILTENSSGGNPTQALLQQWATDYSLTYCLADPGAVIKDNYSNYAVTNQIGDWDAQQGYPYDIVLKPIDTAPYFEMVDYWCGAYPSADGLKSRLQSAIPGMYQ